MPGKGKYKKDSFTESKRKTWKRVKAVGCFCRGAPSLMFDRILNATLSDKVSTTGVTQENLELPLTPNSFDSHQTENNKMKFSTDPTFLLP